MKICRLRIPVLILLLIESFTGAQIEAEDKTGMRAIHFAALQGNTELVHTLMDAGASTNFSNVGHYTPLMLAVSSNSTETAHALISRDCYLYGFNPFGASALIMSASKNMSSIAIAILEKGADNIDKADKIGGTALMYAASLGLDDLVIALVSKGNFLSSFFSFHQARSHLYLHRGQCEHAVEWYDSSWRRCQRW